MDPLSDGPLGRDVGEGLAPASGHIRVFGEELVAKRLGCGPSMRDSEFDHPPCPLVAIVHQPEVLVGASEISQGENQLGLGNGIAPRDRTRGEKLDAALEELDCGTMPSCQVVEAPLDDERVGGFNRVFSGIEDCTRLPHEGEPANVTEGHQRGRRFALKASADDGGRRMRQRALEVLQGLDRVARQLTEASTLLLDGQLFLDLAERFSAFERLSVAASASSYANIRWASTAA